MAAARAAERSGRDIIMEAAFQFLDANSWVPRIGFPVDYAVLGVLLTILGHVAMVLS